MGQWSSPGLVSNPAANAILAEVVVPDDNARRWQVCCSASVAATVVIEHRDAANAATVLGHSQGFFVPASGSVMAVSDIPVPFAAGERLRVRLNAAITGAIWCSVLIE